MGPAPQSRPPAASPLRLFARGIFRFCGILLILFGISLLLGRLLPVPSTLMLGRWVSGQPVERQWRSLDQISPHLVRGVIVSEDQRYCAHSGVDFIALRDVLDEEGGPSRGASTVTMQVAKNVYLWPGRSYVRKALEVPLALVLDLVWGKRRVMEIYLNVAEWGSGLYGAESAAQHYFGKAARDLTAQEAARLVAALPNPLVRKPGRASSASRRVQSRMADAEALLACVVAR